jgi:hypothetical protein
VGATRRPSATIDDAAAETTFFTADTVGEVTFELTVDDGELSDTDTVTFTISEDARPTMTTTTSRRSTTTMTTRPTMTPRPTTMTPRRRRRRR